MPTARVTDAPMRSWLLLSLLLGSLGWAVAAASGAQQGPGAAPAGDQPWAMTGLDTAETHYSPLRQITADNVQRLGLAWAADIDAFPGQIQGAPLLVDGTLYGTGPWSVVFAVDARTGRLKWRWDPKIPHQTFATDARGVRQRLGPSLCCGPVNRGVAYHDGKVFVGTLDSRLVALDAPAPAGRCGARRWRARPTTTASAARPV